MMKTVCSIEALGTIHLTMQCYIPGDWNYTLRYIQGVSRLVDITAGGDFLGLCDQKVHINVCPIFGGCGVTGIF